MEDNKTDVIEVITTVNAQGQVFIPREILKILKVKPGDWVVFKTDGREIIMEKIADDQGLDIHRKHSAHKKKADLSRYGIPTERGSSPEQFLKEIREDR